MKLVTRLFERSLCVAKVILVSHHFKILSWKKGKIYFEHIYLWNEPRLPATARVN